MVGCISIIGGIAIPALLGEHTQILLIPAGISLVALARVLEIAGEILDHINSRFHMPLDEEIFSGPTTDSKTQQ